MILGKYIDLRESGHCGQSIKKKNKVVRMCIRFYLKPLITGLFSKHGFKKYLDKGFEVTKILVELKIDRGLEYHVTNNLSRVKKLWLISKVEKFSVFAF